MKRRTATWITWSATGEARNCLTCTSCVDGSGQSMDPQARLEVRYGRCPKTSSWELTPMVSFPSLRFAQRQWARLLFPCKTHSITSLDSYHHFLRLPPRTQRMALVLPCRRRLIDGCEQTSAANSDVDASFGCLEEAPTAAASIVKYFPLLKDVVGMFGLIDPRQICVDAES